MTVTEDNLDIAVREDDDSESFFQNSVGNEKLEIFNFKNSK